MSHTIFENGIGYEGKVTLTLKSNNRVLGSKVYKNKGTLQLFRFLGHCLIGDYAEAAKLLPAKIVLLRNRSANNTADASPTSQIEPCTRPKERIQTPTIISDSDKEQVRVIYNFEVPKTAIFEPFNQIALYGTGMKYPTDLAEFSAYYFLTNTDGTFDLQEPENWSTTTILLIDWELTISNKNVDTNNN